MEVVIVHPLIEVGGGAEKLAIEMHKAFLELGFESRILTFYLDRERLEEAIRLLSPGFTPRLEARPLPAGARFLDTALRTVSGGRMTRFRRAILAGEIIKRLDKSEGLIVDTSSHLPTPVDIAYIHVPLIMPGGRRGFAYRVYERVLKWVADSVSGTPRLVLVNSSWTRDVFLKTYGGGFRVEVLHPPVDVEYFRGEEGVREKIIVTVSRFSPEKKLESILEVARVLGDYEFFIVGSATRKGYSYALKLREKAESMGLGNVRIVVNMPRSGLRDLLRRALFYLHPPYPEHFGLSVAEAVAAGAIPVVYRDGGAWTDIVSRIDPGLGYTDISEVPRIIRTVERSPELARSIRGKGIALVEGFGYFRFKTKLGEVLNRYGLGYK
ncbi:glycosyltransferase [Thermogladius sp. 4427co]|uniref:glycosyltransferase n=1 Tax=Thermogladius sp. 4427co TaxID=3450718 RepID=UPI003F78D800